VLSISKIKGKCKNEEKGKREKRNNAVRVRDLKVYNLAFQAAMAQA
jgi:hypothetical protein